jgi:hypothetical protein
MAVPTDVNLQSVTYQRVDESLANYIVNPYDLQGNVIGSQIVEILTTSNTQLVQLPAISNLEPSNYELTVVNIDGVNFIEVNTSGSDVIGGFGSTVKIDKVAGATLTFSVATNGVWSFQKLGSKF